ncbi:MAG TPA: hypothetical protein VJS66_02700 [Burkholderiales bacterium]|nr:hypothetical protein [Burkholderiales bacterium]
MIWNIFQDSRDMIPDGVIGTWWVPLGPDGKSFLASIVEFSDTGLLTA